MIRGTSEGDFLPQNPLDSGHRTEPGLLRFEHGPLFDVELQVGRGHGAGSAALPRYPMASSSLPSEPLPVGARESPRPGRVHAAHIHETAQHVRVIARALLIGEKARVQRFPGADPMVVQSAYHFERGQHSQTAVVSPAVAHAIYVGAEHHGRAVGMARARPAANAVSDAVHADVEPRVLHPFADQVAAPAVRRSEGEPLDPPSGVAPTAPSAPIVSSRRGR